MIYRDLFLVVATAAIATMVTFAVHHTANTPVAADVSSLDQQTVTALQSALDDERRAEAAYAAVIKKFGSVRPFSNIVRAERQHQALLLSLFETYHVPVPANAWESASQPDFATLRDACGEAARAEVANAEMYDKLLAAVTEPDVRAVFEQLRDNSRYKHLPAFQRCSGSSGGGQGQGRGPGFGR